MVAHSTARCFAGAAAVDDASVSSQQDNALHTACRFGHRVIAQLLLQHGYSASVQGSSGRTPLQLAAAGGSLVHWQGTADETQCADVVSSGVQQQQQQRQQQQQEVQLAPATDAFALAAAARMPLSAAVAMAAAVSSSSSSSSEASGDLAHGAASQQQSDLGSSSGQRTGVSLSFSRVLLCQSLVAAGADLLAVDATGCSVAMCAAAGGLLQLLNSALGATAAAAAAAVPEPSRGGSSSSSKPAVLSAVRAADVAGWTALHWAAANGHHGGFVFASICVDTVVYGLLQLRPKGVSCCVSGWALLRHGPIVLVEEKSCGVLLVNALLLPLGHLRSALCRWFTCAQHSTARCLGEDASSSFGAVVCAGSAFPKDRRQLCSRPVIVVIHLVWYALPPCVCNLISNTRLFLVSSCVSLPR